MSEIVTIGLTVIGLLAFVVSVITELIKDVGKLWKVPTDLVVIILSVVVSVLALLGYNTYAARAFIWYEIVGSVFGGFIVAFVSMYGWERLSDLYSRFKVIFKEYK